MTSETPGPEEGHTFELSFRIRASSKVVGDPEHHDALEFDGHPVSVQVRAWNLRDALAAATALPLSAWAWSDDDEPDVPQAPCPEGFHWIGQSFATCDKCGLPAWEHAGKAWARTDAGPFGPVTGWELSPWLGGEADAMREKWSRRA